MCGWAPLARSGVWIHGGLDTACPAPPGTAGGGRGRSRISDWGVDDVREVQQARGVDTSSPSGGFFGGRTWGGGMCHQRLGWPAGDTLLI